MKTDVVYVNGTLMGPLGWRKLMGNIIVYDNYNMGNISSYTHCDDKTITIGQLFYDVQRATEIGVLDL